MSDTNYLSRKCPRCGADLPPRLPPDLCPKCLLEAGLATQSGQTQAQTADSPAPWPSRAMPKPGEQLGRYRIVRILGEGGMGAVFDAEDLESGRRVALKVLSEKLDSPETRQRFFREGRLAASINHPNSVYVFGTEEIGGIPVIAMELVPGGTLQDRVRERGPLGIAEAVDCILQIIAGLEAANRVGILHRDIKPSNCFVDADNTVKIGDFGLSVSANIRTEPALTARGGFIGTPAFCSPEQLRGDELNVRSDMYSVGATLFHLLTGRTPFEAKDPVKLLATVLEQKAPSPRKFRPAIPTSLAKTVLRCLEKQPGDRFQNYQELCQALTPYTSAAPTPATLGLRFVAGLIDQIVFGAILTLILALTGTGPIDFLNLAGKASLKALPMVLPMFAGSIIYFGVLEGHWGAALGKAICGLRVIGPNRSAPGIGRALARAVIYVLSPILPFWIINVINPQLYVESSYAMQLAMSGSMYVVLAVLFCRARRCNGFASLHDLITHTRVVSRSALQSRPSSAMPEMQPLASQTRRAVGPYQVLEMMEKTSAAEWLLGYDLRLLRKVWIRLVPPGVPPVPAALRGLGRVGRLRWLSGQRSPEANWDAFEAPTGNPLVHLAPTRPRWAQARYWLYDLATEISAAAKDGTLPESLTLDRIWITDDGRAKLLEFPAPGAGGATAPAKAAHSCGPFLSQVAAAGGSTNVPMPVHARRFLERLPTLPDADSVIKELKPLLQRAPAVTRWRRAVILGGCAAAPLLMGISLLFGARMMEQWNQQNPGIMDLSSLLGQHAMLNSRFMKEQPHPTDRQFSIYIASHYRSVITNDAVWTGAYTLMLVKGDDRKFAERSVAEYPSPSAVEIKDAEAALKKYLPDSHALDFIKRPTEPFLMAGGALAIYVCLPAIAAALLFRGGLVLLIAGVTFVRKDGAPASRLRVFWRALVTWSPILVALPFKSLFDFSTLALISLSAIGALAAVSMALPERGLADRLAGTWPVPR
jgi:uncharacterized RDD family membrane protein YckC